jgi:hypothetical protein
MRLDEIFTLDEVPAQTTNYDAIPAGLYEATITSADVKESKSGGKYVNVRYDITGPSHVGRVVFGMITLSNANPKAVEIGKTNMLELIAAIKLDKNLVDTDQLIGGQLIIKLDVEQSEKYGEQNRVRGFRPASKGKPTVAATTNTPPWAKK